MLKLSCMSLSYKDEFASGQLDLEQFIGRAWELNLDGIDIHTRAFASTDPDYLRDIQLRSLKRGLPLGYIGVSNDFGKPAEQLAEQIELTRKWIDVADFMAVPIVRVFAANVTGDDTQEAVWDRMTCCLKEVAEYGRRKGVVVGLQNHNHRNITRTGKDVRRIIDEVDNPYLSHILDTGQYVGSPGASGATERDSESDLYESIAETAPLAMHVRCKIYRIQSGREQWLDYKRIFRVLRNIKYNGWVSVVYEGQEAEAEATAVPKAVKYLRWLIAGQYGGIER